MISDKHHAKGLLNKLGFIISKIEKSGEIQIPEDCTYRIDGLHQKLVDSIDEDQLDIAREILADICETLKKHDVINLVSSDELVRDIVAELYELKHET